MIATSLRVVKRPAVACSSARPPSRHLTFTAAMASDAKPVQATGATFDSIGVKNTNINVASGESLSDEQKVVVGSVLDVSQLRRRTAGIY